MGELSIIVPVYNEEDNIILLDERIKSAFTDSGIDYEVIFVDDGSSDNTAKTIGGCLNSRSSLIELKRNFGQSAALKAGIDHSTGEYIATMDGDLQNDPEDLLIMLGLIKKTDCDIVTGIREKRRDDFILRKIPSILANYLVQKVTHTKIKDNGCGIKVFKAGLLKDLPIYGERHRFLLSLAAMEGAIIEQIAVKHYARVHGRSKYGLGRTIKVISDLILMSFFRKYGQKPMHLFGSVGFFTSLAGSVILIWLLIQKFLGQDIWGRPLLILGVLLLIMGFQIISTGLIMDSIIRKNYETDAAKPYKIKRVLRAKAEVKGEVIADN